MANTIQFKRGGTAPGSLAAGEIAIDTTNQKLYYGNASAQVTEAGGSSAIEASFTADGAISAGDPVGIQASGKVKTIGPGYNTRDVGIGKDSNFAHSVFVPTVKTVEVGAVSFHIVDEVCSTPVSFKCKFFVQPNSVIPHNQD